MAKVSVAFRIIVGICLSGCHSLGLLDISNQSTQLGPLPIKTALKDDSITFRVPLKVEARPTGGYRSLVDAQAEVRLTEPIGIELPLLPNGCVIGLRARW